MPCTAKDAVVKKLFGDPKVNVGQTKAVSEKFVENTQHEKNKHELKSCGPKLKLICSDIPAQDQA